MTKRINALGNMLKDKQNILLVVLMLFGCFIRLYKTSIAPGGLNQDEAYAAYNAYALLNYGVDSFGYHNPVYFTAWGSGMNALESYLMIPFIAMFGMRPGAIRLPQGIFACISLWVFYLLIKELSNKKTAVLGLFVFVVCPWHIMISRWALESNLTPAFLLFGLYFFVKAIKSDIRYIYPCAISYGFSLYCYATIWPILPFMLLFQVVYCVKYKKIELENKHFIMAVIILGIFAFPLILYLMVNYGVVGEIKTRLISIPKLVVMRGDEISLNTVKDNLKTILDLIVSQYDNIRFNVNEDYGIYYKFSNVFVLLGLAGVFNDSCKCIKEKEFSLKVLICIELVFFFILGMLIDSNVNRINCIWIPLIICLVFGICDVVKIFGNNGKCACMAAYIISFTLFAMFYFKEYPKTVEESYFVGLKQAVECAKEYEGTIYLDNTVYYSNVLFYDKTSPYEFMETVKWKNYPSKYLFPLEFTRYKYINVDEIKNMPGNVCIGTQKQKEHLKDLGYEIYDFGIYAVGINEN